MHAPLWRWTGSANPRTVEPWAAGRKRRQPGSRPDRQKRSMRVTADDTTTCTRASLLAPYKQHPQVTLANLLLASEYSPHRVNALRLIEDLEDGALVWLGPSYRCWILPAELVQLIAQEAAFRQGWRTQQGSDSRLRAYSQLLAPPGDIVVRVEFDNCGPQPESRDYCTQLALQTRLWLGGEGVCPSAILGPAEWPSAGSGACNHYLRFSLSPSQMARLAQMPATHTAFEVVLTGYSARFPMPEHIKACLLDEWLHEQASGDSHQA